MSLPDYVIKEEFFYVTRRGRKRSNVCRSFSLSGAGFRQRTNETVWLDWKIRDLPRPASYPGLTNKTRRLRVVEKCCSKLVTARTPASFVLWARSHTDSPHLWRPNLNFHSSYILARFPRDSCYSSMTLTFPLKEVIETYSNLLRQSPLQLFEP